VLVINSGAVALKLIHVRDAKPHAHTHVQFLPRHRRLLGPILLKVLLRVRTTLLRYGKIVEPRLFIAKSDRATFFCHLFEGTVKNPQRINAVKIARTRPTQGRVCNSSFCAAGKISIGENSLFTLDLARCAINAICHTGVYSCLER
jgi:hypothetical protein